MEEQPSHQQRGDDSEFLRVSGISKSFFTAPVLKNVSFALPRGTALGLVGENGAGKSTLMNILGGNLQPDSGALWLDGKEIKPRSPQDAERNGIAFIHQELNLFPNLSISENIFLTTFPRHHRLPLIHRREMHHRTATLLAAVGLEADPGRLVERLSAGERQLVEIAKALSRDARLIIFDEPTTSLTVRETDRLFALIERIRRDGISLIYISHTLGDVFRLCQNLVVLRDGEVVAEGAMGTFTIEKVVSLMVGRPLANFFPERSVARSESSPSVSQNLVTDRDDASIHAATRCTDTRARSRIPLLEARGLTRAGAVENVSLTLSAGEVLGLAGLMGAGRSELARLLFGLDRRTSGELMLNGQMVSRISPREMMKRGMAFLTENRRTEGLCLDAGISDNLALAALPSFAGGLTGWLSFDSLRAAVQRVRAVAKLDPRAQATQPVRTLSGGNQQKVVLGKWLLREPNVFILDEPTRGIDVGAKYEIYRLIFDLANRGAGVLLISSEMEELTALSDRILVLRRGHIVDELPRDGFDRERIMRAALGGQESR